MVIDWSTEGKIEKGRRRVLRYIARVDNKIVATVTPIPDDTYFSLRADQPSGYTVERNRLPLRDAIRTCERIVRGER